ncbi:MAG: DUF3662 and FHA domain-containing protein [Microbacterium sp.]
MGLLDSFEKGLERAVNGAFAKTFRSGLQPVEIASALRSELDKRAAIVSRDRVLVPNSFTVRLSPADAARMQEVGSPLDDELESSVRRHASSQGYSFAGKLSIELRADPQISTGTLAVDSETASGPVAWNAVLEVAGRRHPITQGRTVIGRGSDADITVSDAGTSRKHVEVLWDGRSAMVHDLESTNGSKLDGHTVKKAALSSGQTITIGRTNIVFRLVPSAPSRAPQVHSSATEMYDFRGSAS